MTDIGTTPERMLREQFPPPRFRVSRHVLAAGTHGPYVTSGDTCYVVDGACRFTRQGFDLQLARGDCGHLPAGSYRFEAMGEAKVELIHVWDIGALAATNRRQADACMANEPQAGDA